jgi:hypothetical protein
VTGAYAKPLTLKVEGQPSGVTATIAPASIAPGTGKATATIAPALTATPGNYTLVLSTNAADGSPTQSLPITLTVKPPTTFFLTSSQPSLKILQGTSGQLTLTTAHSGAFASAVVALTIWPADVGHRIILEYDHRLSRRRYQHADHSHGCDYTRGQL